MSEYGNHDLCSLRAALLDHPIYTQVASIADLRQFMEGHVFAVWAASAGYDVCQGPMASGGQ